MARFFSSGAIDFGPWSPSKAGVLKECPLKFIYQYISKPNLSGDLAVETDNSALVMGSAVHKYAEHKANGVDTHTALVDAFAEIPATKKNKITMKTQVRGIDDFNKRMETFKSKNKVTLDATELRLGVDADLNSVDFWDKNSVLRGVLDRLLIVEKSDGLHGIAIDIKTGRTKPVETYEMQLESYGVLLHSRFDLVSVSMAAFFSSSGELAWYTRKVGKADINQTNPVFTQINSLVETIDPSNLNKGRHCSWCNYRLVCEKDRSS